MIEALRGLMGAASGYGMLWLGVAGLAGLMLTALGSLMIHVLRMLRHKGAPRRTALLGGAAAGGFVLISLALTFGGLREREPLGLGAALLAVAGIALSHLSALRRRLEEPAYAALHTGLDKIALLGLAASLFVLFAPRLMVLMR